MGLLALSVLLAVAGCSSGGGGSSESSAGAGGAAVDAQVERSSSQGGNALAGGAADFSAPHAAPPRSQPPSRDPIDVTPRAEIKTAAIGIKADDVDKVLQQISDVAVASRGEITSEDTSTNRQGDAVHSRIVLRVPVDEFESTVTGIAGLGVRYSLTRSVEDVTAEVADIDSRVQSAQDSIAQLRRLFTAAKKLGDIIALESELSQREADLEALQAQQRALADQTALSTITISVSQTTTPASISDDNDKAGGFVAGLKSGWDTLVGFVRALSHGIGLVLPLGTILLLAGVLVWFLVRRFTPWLQPRGNG